jgi:hypothetical protein
MPRLSASLVASAAVIGIPGAAECRDGRTG